MANRIPWRQAALHHLWRTNISSCRHQRWRGPGINALDHRVYHLHDRSTASLCQEPKHADDSYLLIGSNNIGSVDDELKHIIGWAETKHLRLNLSKSVSGHVNRILVAGVTK